jgi:hypothetical protein
LVAVALTSAAFALAGCGGGGDSAPAAAASTPPAPIGVNEPPPLDVNQSPTVGGNQSPTLGGDLSPTLGGNQPPGGANQPPTISGAPPRSVASGNAFAFTPTTNDADGDLLTFAVEGQPAWTAFDPLTGRISGKPTQNDVGKTAPIAISATDGEATVELAAFTIDVVGTAPDTVSLVWMPPTENEDGSPLTDLAGYKLYWGTSAGDYPNSVTLMNPSVTRYLIEQLTPATWYFVMTALTARDLESAHSKPAAHVVRK